MKRSAGSKGTVLLLCSDTDVLHILQHVLEDGGYVVLPAKNLGSAVDQLADCKPNLLVVRPYLESISGHQAALYLRTRCSGLPVLMLAGMPDDDRVINRESLRGIELFPKPFSLAEFLDKVAAMLAPVHEETTPKPRE
jgi:DNA-binding response OmpR family regulator